MIPEYALLVAISWFYLAEHIRFENFEVAALSIKRGRVVNVSLPPTSFTILGRIVYVIPPVNLFEGRVFGKLGPKIRPTKSKEIVKILLYSKILQPLMWVEILSIVFYIVVVPILFLILSIYLLASAIILFHLILWTTTTIYLYAVMGRWAFRDKCKICIAFEMLISPGLMAAVRRRLENYLNPEGDVILNSYEFLSSEKSLILCNLLEARIFDLVDYQEITQLEAVYYINIVRSIHVRD
jgi:hypothetical protein